VAPEAAIAGSRNTKKAQTARNRRTELKSEVGRTEHCANRCGLDEEVFRGRMIAV